MKIKFIKISTMEDIKINLTSQVKAVISHYQAKKDKAIANLEVFLNRPVGNSGGKKSLVDETIDLFEELNHSDSMIKMITSIIITEEELQERTESNQIHK